jgi:hypothetical protein
MDRRIVGFRNSAFVHELHDPTIDGGRREFGNSNKTWNQLRACTQQTTRSQRRAVCKETMRTRDQSGPPRPSLSHRVA